jgi:hypothetical protein
MNNSLAAAGDGFAEFKTSFALDVSYQTPNPEVWGDR